MYDRSCSLRAPNGLAALRVTRPAGRAAGTLALIAMIACGNGGGGEARRHAPADAGRGPYALGHRLRERSLASIRGVILDRRGVVLADNLLSPSGPTRHYPRGDLAAHVLGYLTAPTADELARLAPMGYGPDDRIGRYGLENEWENYLRGKRGIEPFVIDAQGQPVHDAAAADLLRHAPRIEPVAGNRLVLTLDAALQRLAEEAVAMYRAAAVAVVEVATGKILALVSKPSFDPGVMSGAPTKAELALLVADPRKPFVDKTLAARYAPGGAFAFVAKIAARIEGVAVDEVSLDQLAAVATELGFGAPTGLGLNGDVGGRVPTQGWYEQRGRFRAEHARQAAAGQGDVEVTVLQVAMAYAALAADGRLQVPQLVERVETPDGKLVSSYPPKLARTATASTAILDEVRRGMRLTKSLSGTAATAAVRPSKIKGAVPGESHAWFAGWAPATDPQIAIVVLIEHGGDGEVATAPAAAIAKGWSP